MKIAVSMIVFNGNYVLNECLASIYPYVDQILIAEGPVYYWQNQGFTTSTDGTNDVLHNFPDPQNKIRITHGQFNEKDDQCNAAIQGLKDDNDYIWNLDCDEVFKPEHVEKLLKILDKDKYTSVGFKSKTYYGGFDHILAGFEWAHEFMRIRKIYPGSTWLTHRPPTMKHIVKPWKDKHLGHEFLYDKHGICMYHYSYVFPNQVQEKVSYYKAAVSKDNCIDDYFRSIYLPWVTEPFIREGLEKAYNGVHEFKPEYRGSCFTDTSNDHPPIIRKNMSTLKKKFNDQLQKFMER